MKYILAKCIFQVMRALIRILGKDDLTGLFYVKNDADSKQRCLIYLTYDKFAVLTTLSDTFGHILKMLKCM